MIALEQNYRSTGSILAAANAVIGQQPKLFEKKLWSELGAGEPVALVECDDEVHEAERAVARIGSLRGAGAAVRRLRRPLPRQPPGARLRAGAAQGADPVQGLGRAELLRARRDPRRVRVAAPDRQPATTTRRSCARWRARSAASATRRSPRSAASPAAGSRACSRRCSPSRSPTRCRARAIAALHEFGRGVNDAAGTGAATVGGEPPRRLLVGWLKDIGYEEHLHERRGVARARRRALGQRARLRRLDRAALRRHAAARRPATRRRRRASSPSRRRSRSSSAWPSAATTRTSSRCRRCTPPRASSGRT